MTDNPLAEWLRARERDHRQDAADTTDSRACDDGYDGGSPTDAVPPDGIRPPAAPWDDLTAEEPTRPRRRWAVFTAALVPWVVAGLFVASLTTSGDVARPHSADMTGEEDPTQREMPTASEVPPTQAAAAVLAVRTAGVASPVAGTEEEHPPPPRRYVDLAVAESVTPIGDIAVVTVAATVLEGTGERWQRTRLARFGVAVRDTEDGAVAVGRPWPLPGPAPAEEPAWRKADGDAEPVEAALAAAGYGRLHEVELFRSEAVPGVIRVECRAVAPGEASPRRHAVWVADELTPTVLGDPERGSPVPRSETSTR